MSGYTPSCSGFTPVQFGEMMLHAQRPVHQRKVHPRAVNRPAGRGGYFARYPKDKYETVVEAWRHLQCNNYEFTMKRLREPKQP
jgi:hypothetical protein